MRGLAAFVLVVTEADHDVVIGRDMTLMPAAMKCWNSAAVVGNLTSVGFDDIVAHFSGGFVSGSFLVYLLGQLGRTSATTRYISHNTRSMSRYKTNEM